MQNNGDPKDVSGADPQADSRRWVSGDGPGGVSSDEGRSGSDAEDGSKALVDVVYQYVGQPASLFSEE